MQHAQVMEPELTIIVGATGSGKSTWMADFAKRYKRNFIAYKHYVNIDDKAFAFLTEKTMSNYRQGVKPGEIVKCKIAGRDEKDFLSFLDWCDTDFRHGLVAIDDSILFERDRPSKKFLNFLVMKRHYAMNIFVVYHSLSAIPIEMFTYANKIVLFNTTDNTRYKKNKISNYDALQKGIAMARANRLNPATRYKPVIVKLQ